MFLYTKKLDMNWPRGYKSLLILLLAGLAAIPSQAQMKLGGQAESPRLDAALEISSTKKGLLLPRVTNAALTSNPLDSAAQGMMVFNVTDQTLYVKRASGYTGWAKVPDLTTYALGNLSDINFPVAPANNQLLRYNGTKWSNWTPDFIKTMSGDVTAGAVDAAGNVATTLSNFGTAGTYFKVTTDAKGRVQSGATSLVAGDIPSLATLYIQNQTAALQTGDFRIGGSGSLASLTVTGLNTQGGLLFTSNTGAVSQKAGQLIWDNTNNRLGIGLAAPAAKLDVEGDFKLGADGTVLTSITKIAFTTTGNQNCGGLATTNVTYTLPAGVVLKADDNVIISPGTNLASGLAIGWARVSNAGSRQITVGYVNGSTGNKSIPINTRLNITLISL